MDNIPAKQILIPELLGSSSLMSNIQHKSIILLGNQTKWVQNNIKQQHIKKCSQKTAVRILPPIQFMQFRLPKTQEK